MDRNALIELAAMWNDQDYTGSSIQSFLSAWQAVCEVFDFPYASEREEEGRGRIPVPEPR
jgi:hypothetical protein